MPEESPPDDPCRPSLRLLQTFGKIAKDPGQAGGSAVPEKSQFQGVEPSRTPPAADRRPPRPAGGTPDASGSTDNFSGIPPTIGLADSFLKHGTRLPLDCMTSSTSALFLSDLHLLSRRSSAPRLDAMIRKAVGEAPIAILGGDIFDFRWSTHPNLEQSIARSMDWLEQLVSSETHCQFHYLLGNHDSNPEFVAALDRLSRQLPRLQWHRHLLRLDHSVFLHGDVVDAPLGNHADPHPALDAWRSAADERPQPHPVSHALYEAVVRTRAHRLVVRLAKRPRTVLDRVARYLANQGLHPGTGIEDVYFGHTHRQMQGVGHAGMSFYNPGAAIRGLPFQILATRPLLLPGTSPDS